MGSSGKAVCFRVLTVVFGILLWLIGVAILGFSIYLRVDYWINQYVGASEELTKYTVSVYIFIAAGAVIILFCIVGIYGAIRPDKCALIVYMIYLPLMLSMMIGSGVYAYIYREEIENTIKNSSLLREIVQLKYGGSDRRVTQAIDYMQKELGCCGGSSYTDYGMSQWRQSYTEGELDQRKDMTPLSCCKNIKTYEDIPGQPYTYCPMYKLGEVGEQLKEPNPFIWKRGCGEAFVELIQENIGIAAAICFSIVAVILLAIIFCALLLFFLRKSPVPREDDVVYEMARTQEKSPYPARGGPYANLYQS